MTAPPPMLQLSGEMRAVFDRLRRDGELLFGTRPVHIHPVAFQTRESSEVARALVTSSAPPRHLFAKVFKPRSSDSGIADALARLRADYAVTRRVCDAMRATSDLRAVEPIACYEDLLAIVTNEAPGIPLSVAMAAAAWPTNAARLTDLEAALSRVGRWMAMFQRVAPDAQSSPVSLAAMRDYIDARLEKLTNLPRARFTHSDRREVLAYFDRRAADVSTSELVEVPVHGDIVPSNVIVGPDTVTVLDFGMTARGSKYLDVARLYTQLEFHTAKPQYRRPVIARLQRAVLAGFAPDLRPDDPLFELCTVQHVVCHLLSHARQPGPFPASLYSAHQCREHRRWLRRRAGLTAQGSAAAAGAIGRAQ